MRSKMRLLACVFVALVLGKSVSADPPAPDAKEPEPSRRCEPGPRDVLAVDAVELVRSGKEVPGDEARATVHGPYTYRFANAENREEFLKDPAKYEIQLGGACARMGPLSGIGSAKLFAVHERKVYIFASGACRAAFVKKPEAYLETSDPRPTPDAKAIEEGRAIFARAIKAHGGEEAIGKLRSVRLTTVGEADNQGKKVATGTTLRIAFGATGLEAVREEERWGEYAWGSALRGGDGGDGWLYDRKSVKVMAASQREALARVGSRPLAAVLRCGLMPGAVVWRVEPVAAGEQRAGAAVEFVSVWTPSSARAGESGGVVCTLGVDRATGRIVHQRFRGRGANLTIGEMERRFGDYREVSGVLMPFTMDAKFNGQSAASAGGGETKYAEIVGNEAVEVGDLERAK